jgi:metal-dependent hydrolase (beta-lactamase superfamily II)
MQQSQGLIQNLRDLKLDLDGVFAILIMKNFDDHAKGRFEDVMGDSSTMPSLQILCQYLEKEYAISARNKELGEKEVKKYFTTTTRTHASANENVLKKTQVSETERSRHNCRSLQDYTQS